MSLTIQKHHLASLVTNGILKDDSAVDVAWNELSQQCAASTVAARSATQTVPSLDGNLKSDRVLNDVCIIYSLQNGQELASLIERELKRKGVSVALAYTNGSYDTTTIETFIANSVISLVLLTPSALAQKEVVFGMTAAKLYYKTLSQIVLVHDAGSCLFPSPEEIPTHLSDIFSEKAITFLTCNANANVRLILLGYVHESVNELDDKITNEMQALENATTENNEQLFKKLSAEAEDSSANNKQIPVEQVRTALESIPKIQSAEVKELMATVNKNNAKTVSMLQFSELLLSSEKLREILKRSEADEDVSTRLFLSHKRTTGQAVAGRLYEGLKDDYKIFLDSEAKFKIHNLRKIVECTQVFVFIITDGIWLSRWCMEELKSAVSNGKKIIVVRDLASKIPDVLPSAWEEVGPALRSADQLIWLAEFNTPCIKALKRLIGPSDAALKFVETAKVKKDDRMIKEWMNTGFLDLNSGGMLDPGFVRGITHMFPDAPVQRVKLSGSRLCEQDFYAVRNAEELQIESSLFRDADVQHEFPNLKSLVIRQCMITDLGVTAMLRGSPNLTSLALVDNQHVTAVSLQYLIKSKLRRNITELRLSGFFMDDGVKLLTRLENLEDLNVNDCPINTSLIDVASHCTKLKKLKAHSTDISDSTVIEIAKKRSELSCLELRSCYCLQSSWADHVSEFKALEVVNLASNQVNDKAITQLLQHHGASLKELVLSSCSQLTTASLQLIPQHCHNLETLYLNSLPVQDDFVVSLAACTKLKKLDLSSTQVTDQGVEGLVKMLKVKTISLNATKCTKALRDAVGAEVQLDGVPYK